MVCPNKDNPLPHASEMASAAEREELARLWGNPQDVADFCSTLNAQLSTLNHSNNCPAPPLTA